MLAFRDVSRRYGATLALEGVSFTLEPSGLTALVGPNGAGKSTLLRLAARLEQPSTGVVTGVDRRDLAWLGQEPGLYGSLTVRENMVFAARFFGHTGRVDDAAAAFGIAHRLGAQARTLSRGEAQRAALARASLCGPVMILDEPTNALDADAAEACAHTLRELAEKKTLLVATHDAELQKGADRVLTLRGGRLT